MGLTLNLLCIIIISRMKISSGASFFQDVNIQKLLQITKQSYLPYLKDTLEHNTVQARQNILKGLNVKLFNLKLKAEVLSDSSFASTTNLLTLISSSPHTVTGIINNVNTTPQLNRVVSATAQDITGEDTANEYTKLSGVYGEIIIQGEKILIGFSSLDIKSYSTGEDSLSSIVRKINNKELNVSAEVLNNRLVISSHQDINFADNTYGGSGDGLSLRVVPVRDEEEILSNFVQDNFSPANLATTQKYSSYKISEIADNENATANTPLYGLQGNIIINNIAVGVNPGGIVDTPQDIINRIKTIYNIGAIATFEDGRLVIKSQNLTKLLTITDETEGGYTSGLGLNRAGREVNGDNSASLFFENYNLKIISLVSRQKNISYSAEEITGSTSTDENTTLNLSGDLTVNDTKIYLSSSQSLQDIAELINTLQGDVEAEISGKNLLLKSVSSENVYFKIVDNTTGGERDGLGIGKLTQEVISLPAKIITGSISADESTVLNISGTLRIGDKIINIGKEYATNTLSEIATRINSTYDIGVTATVENNQLVIKGDAEIDFVDAAEGGFGGVDGALGLSYKGTNYILQPHNAVFSVSDKIYSSSSDFTSDGVPLVNFVLKSAMQDDEENAISTQLTSLDNVSGIRENIINLTEEYNSIMSDLNKLTGILSNGKVEEGMFFKNSTLENLKQNLKDIFSDKTKESMQKIGFTFLPDNTVDINQKKFYQNIEKNFPEVINTFTSPEEGVAQKINELFEDIVLGDGLPNVDVRDESRYSYYQNIKLLNFLSFSPGQLVNIFV